MERDMIDAVLYDLDGTLVDFIGFKEATTRAAARAMIRHGLQESEEFLYRLIFMVYDAKGMEYQKTYSEVVREFGLGMNDAEKIQQAAILAHQRVMHDALQLFPMVRTTLEEIRIRWPRLMQAVVTDAPRNKAWKRLVLKELPDVFDEVITYSDTGTYKPDPLPFELATKELGVKASRCLFVGDDPGRDIKGAKEVGMHTCWAKRGFERGRGYRRYDEAERVAADFQIGRFDGLIGIVERLANPELSGMVRWGRASRLWRKGRVALKGANERAQARLRTLRLRYSSVT